MHFLYIVLILVNMVYFLTELGTLRKYLRRESPTRVLVIQFWYVLLCLGMLIALSVLYVRG